MARIFVKDGFGRIVPAARRNPSSSSPPDDVKELRERGVRSAGSLEIAPRRVAGSPPQYHRPMGLPPGVPRINPAAGGIDEDDRREAIAMYKRFQRLEPKNLGEFAGSMRIPDKVHLLGKAEWVTYRSGKVDPETLKKPRKTVDYIHEHDAGVRSFCADGDGELVDVPRSIREITALCLLGDLLGFGWKDDEGEHEAKATSPRPELYTIPSGKALVVVQDKKEILAMMWGGGLGVEGRGIVG